MSEVSVLTLLLVIGAVLWFGVFFLVDRPSIPAYSQRDWWRTLSAVLFLLVIVLGYKALQYNLDVRVANVQLKALEAAKQAQ